MFIYIFSILLSFLVLVLSTLLYVYKHAYDKSLKKYKRCCIEIIEKHKNACIKDIKDIKEEHSRNGFMNDTRIILYYASILTSYHGGIVKCDKYKDLDICQGEYISYLYNHMIKIQKNVKMMIITYDKDRMLQIIASIKNTNVCVYKTTRHSIYLEGGSVCVYTHQDHYSNIKPHLLLIDGDITKYQNHEPKLPTITTVDRSLLVIKDESLWNKIV
jgi:hypothetical protein